MWRLETIKILEEITGSNFSYTGHCNTFLDMSSKAKETKAKLNYWDYVKIKSLCNSRRNCQQNKKTTYRTEEDICKYISDKGLISKKHKEVIQHYSKKTI